MLHQRTQKSSASHPQTQQQSSQFAPRPFAIQAQPETQKPATQEEIENEAFNQNKFEAFGLQLKEKSGTIAPVEQERLGVLQAKMNDLMVQRQERTSRNGFNLIGIPIHSADAKGNEARQTKLLQKSDREGEQQQFPQESSETASNEGMDLVQRTFQETNPQSHPVPPIQAKLTIGQPGDKYEQEADSVAAKVVEKINAPASGQSTQGQPVQRQEEDKEEEVQAKLEISPLQRMEEPKEEDIQGKLIQKQGDAIGGGEASTDLDSAINTARGGGQPLEAGLQRSMGQAMRADFSRVKVHTDAQADQLNRSVQARAFTTGQDVFFRQGEYNPGSRGGQELIAHELTHVVQQNRGTVKGSQPEVSKGTMVSTAAELPIQRMKPDSTNQEEVNQLKGTYLAATENNYPGWDKTLSQAKNIEHLKTLVNAVAPLEEIQDPQFDPENYETWSMLEVGGVGATKKGELVLDAHDENWWNLLAQGNLITNGQGQPALGQPYHAHMVSNGNGGIAFYYRRQDETNFVQPIIYDYAIKRNGNNYRWKVARTVSNSHPPIPSQ